MSEGLGSLLYHPRLSLRRAYLQQCRGSVGQRVLAIRNLSCMLSQDVRHLLSLVVGLLGDLECELFLLELNRGFEKLDSVEFVLLPS